jgi:hypothetical protein
MPEPSALFDEIVLSPRRTWEYRFECYEADGLTELVVQSSDVFRFKVWLTDDATPALEADSVGPGSQAFTNVAATDVITSAAHGRQDGDKVHVASSGTLPAPLSAGTTYFVRDATTNTFKLALSSGGSAIDLTDTGSGTHTWYKNTPATVTVRFGQLDTASLTEGDYEGELTMVDDSDNDYIKEICRGRVNVRGTATGEIGLT